MGAMGKGGWNVVFFWNLMVREKNGGKLGGSGRKGVRMWSCLSGFIEDIASCSGWFVG